MLRNILQLDAVGQQSRRTLRGMTSSRSDCVTFELPRSAKNARLLHTAFAKMSNAGQGTEVDTKSPATCASNTLARNNPTFWGLWGGLTPNVVRFGDIEAHCPGFQWGITSACRRTFGVNLRNSYRMERQIWSLKVEEMVSPVAYTDCYLLHRARF